MLGGVTAVPPLCGLALLHAPAPRKQGEGAAVTLQASPLPRHRPGGPPRPRARALTLKVCFLLMLSEGCTAATRKLRRGMLPRMLSSFSSGGKPGGLGAR